MNIPHPRHSLLHALVLAAGCLPVAASVAAGAPVLERSWERGSAPVSVIERSWTRPADDVAEGLVLVRVVTQAAPPQVVPVDGEIVLHATAEASPPAVDRTEAPLWLTAARPVDDSAMAELRGGFVMPDGLKVSFGIERVVMINGVLASTTTLNLTDLGKLVGTGGGNVPPAIANSLAVIQNGPNNLFTGDVINASGFATVIQNSLDNQRIQTITTINTQVNSGELLRAHRFGEALRDVMLR